MLKQAAFEVVGLADVEAAFWVLKGVDGTFGHKKSVAGEDNDFKWDLWSKMAARARFELATKWLTATCSTTELPSNLSSRKGKIRKLGEGLSTVF